MLQQQPQPLQQQRGAPGTPCGASLPPGTPDPGYCQRGAFCASCKGNAGCTDDRSLCRPVPAGCGTRAAAAGPAAASDDPRSGCCPPNAVRRLGVCRSSFALETINAPQLSPHTGALE